MEKIYTSKQVRDIFQITEATLASWCSAGVISYRRIGRDRRFTQSDIDEVLERNKREAI